MIEGIDVRIRYAKGAPIALCEPLSPAGQALLLRPRARTTLMVEPQCDHQRSPRTLDRD
jgi:hypothetical protein